MYKVFKLFKVEISDFRGVIDQMGYGKTVIYFPKQNEFVCIVGALEVSPLPRS